MLQNNVTGEHSCIVLKLLKTADIENTGNGPVGFLTSFYQCKSFFSVDNTQLIFLLVPSFLFFGSVDFLLTWFQNG